MAIPSWVRSLVVEIATSPEMAEKKAPAVLSAVEKALDDMGQSDAMPSLRTVQELIKEARPLVAAEGWKEKPFSIGALAAHGAQLGPEDLNAVLSLMVEARVAGGELTNREAVWGARLRSLPLLLSPPARATHARTPLGQGATRPGMSGEEIEQAMISSMAAHRQDPGAGGREPSRANRPGGPLARLASPPFGLQGVSGADDWNERAVSTLLYFARLYAGRERVAVALGEELDTRRDDVELLLTWLEGFRGEYSDTLHALRRDRSLGADDIEASLARDAESGPLPLWEAVKSAGIAGGRGRRARQASRLNRPDPRQRQ